jgi:pSer/pThr/pTyr-binding forkhead associated (FHA) protein
MHRMHACPVPFGLGALASSFDRDQHVIGRPSRCDIRLHHRSVSRHHAILIVEQPEPIVHDLGSTTRTFVNENRVSDAKITIGTLLHFGRVTAEVWDEHPEPWEVGDDQLDVDDRSDADDSAAMLRIRAVSLAPRRSFASLSSNTTTYEQRPGASLFR